MTLSLVSLQTARHGIRLSFESPGECDLGYVAWSVVVVPPTHDDETVMNGAPGHATSSHRLRFL